MKYVMIDYSIPIIFTEAHAHKYFEGFGHITSAGFFKIFKNDADEMDVETYGFSVSMKMGPDENDKNILRRNLFDIEADKEMFNANLEKMFEIFMKEKKELDLI